MTQSLSLIPGFLSGITAAQSAASAGITGAYSMITPAQLSSFSTALGPLGVANMIPAFYEATGNNVTSGMLTATNHSMLGTSTNVAQTSYVTGDSGADAFGGAEGTAMPAGNDVGPAPAPADTASADG